MNNDIFTASLEAFPQYNSIYLSLDAVDQKTNPDDFFEIEIDRSKEALKNLLTILDPTYTTERNDEILIDTNELCDKALDTGMCSFYTDRQSLGNLVDLYCGSPNKEMNEFPGTGQADTEYPDKGVNMFITESRTLKKAFWFNEQVLPEGTNLVLKYKGRI